MATDTRLSEGTFKKCDMHVHSSSCYSRSYDEASFLSKVLSSDLDVLAVTDHNNIDVELLKSLHSELNAKGKTLIGGVEINIKLKQSTIDMYHLTLGNGKKGNYFHAIVWFDMNKAAKMADIIKNLFVDAILKGSNPNGLTEDRLRSLSSKDFSKQTEGIAIYLEDFQKEASVLQHFFIPHENKDRSLSQYLPNSSHANGDYKDRLFYYSHAMAVEGGEKSRKHISRDLAHELNTTVAALLFSDAKALDEIGSKFTWIDFDGDLESLLLAISDPESRIRTSDRYPMLPQTNTAGFLKSVSFDVIRNDGSRHVSTLPFTPGYNGIVGSRGSGKTLLASLLAGKGLDTYAKIVDTDSVKFTTYGGTPSTDHPQCLYLGQGELECIFRDGKYEEIPFLNERISPLKQSAENESKKAKKRLNDVIYLEKNLLLAFNTKYSSGSVHMDHLDSEAPSGISIATPTRPDKEIPKINQAKTELDEMLESLEAALNTSASVSFKNTYPEDKELFASLETEVRSIEKELSNLKQKTTRLSNLLEGINSNWFDNREQLITEFFSTARKYNSESGSTALTQYREKTREVAAFFDDLVELRLSLKWLSSEAQSAYEKMHSPIEPVELNDGEDSIVISLAYSEETTFDDKFGELLSSRSGRDSQTLVEAFLHTHDSNEMHARFNGTKFRGVSEQPLKEHYEKFFDLLNNAVAESDKLKTDITVNGKQVNDMSPGTKAQALLKLFLNDGVVEGKSMYIVLDQPEDNLDVATIKDFLIDRLKKLKFDIQLFVVSHSAPVIVNGDARNVIVCENDEDNFSYVHGAMNDGTIKQKIADVLDGGERYLKMRLNKYNFQVGDER
ncbi:hypothetical protein [Curtanaerobium respiraculi]|uniref:hypothetical protein n=1 Tax=Curtanaerobium respiraculi TaxID=2949669 RepID=UPI0024B3A2E0|nr:hypothetical protein [Curtanaerobium respiraculi]